MSLNSDDKMEIQELAIRYANAMDNGDLNAWLDTWTDNGIWQGGLGKYEGKSSLSQLLGDLGARIQGKRHVMSNFIIDGNNEEARQTCYMLIFERENSTKLIASGVYTDIVKKINGKWKFTQRTIKLDPSFTV